MSKKNKISVIIDNPPLNEPSESLIKFKFTYDPNNSNQE